MAQLGDYGLEWSTASLSDAERAWNPVTGRNREFTASDLVTFSLAYKLPLSFWLLPMPDIGPDASFGLLRYGQLDMDSYLGLVFASSPELRDRMSLLGRDPSIADKDRQQMLSLLDEQKRRLGSMLEELSDTIAQLTDQPAGGEEE